MRGSPSYPRLRLQGCRTALRLFAFVLLVIPHVLAQPPLPDYQVKAAFLYHFTQFVEWPAPGNADPFLMCIAESPRTSSSLAELTRGRSVGPRPIRVTQVKASEDLHNCNVLFIAACSGLRLQQYLASVHDLTVLTVGEQPGFVQAGGMVELFQHDQRIAFTIGADAMQKVHLNASSKLLRLARPTDFPPAEKGYR